MLAYFAIALYILASIVALIMPQLALLLFWPLTICYPHWLLWGRLPLNIGLDDIFLICLFVGSFIRSRGKPQVVWPVVAAILFLLLSIIGDISTIVTGGDIAVSYALKRWLKSMGLIFLVFAISSSIQTPQQIKKLIYSVLFGSMLAALLVILYTANPYAYNPWQIPAEILGRAGATYKTIRPIGPFSEHDIAGGVLGFCVLLGYFMIRLSQRGSKQIALAIMTGLMLLGLLLSGSRTGWAFVVIPLIVSSLLSRKRLLGFCLLALLAIVFFVGIAKFGSFAARVQFTITQISFGNLQDIIPGRVREWEAALAEPSLKWLFFGKGFAIMREHPHSNYIAALVNMGVIGIVFWIIFYKKIFAKSLWLIKHDLAQDTWALFNGIFWAYTGYFLYFITSTPMMWAPVRFVDFLLMTIICLRVKQVETEQEYYYQLDTYPEELYYSDEPEFAS